MGFCVVNVPRTLICGSYRVTQPQRWLSNRSNEIGGETSPWCCQSKDAHPSTPRSSGQRPCPVGRIDSAEVSDVFLAEGAVITGIFYRQERDIYTADVRDDRGGPLLENDETFFYPRRTGRIYSFFSLVPLLFRFVSFRSNRVISFLRPHPRFWLLFPPSWRAWTRCPIN